MSEHGWCVGDRAVVCERAGGSTWYSFGVVERATKTTIRLRPCRTVTLEHHGSPANSDALVNSDFVPNRDAPLETYRWLPSMEEMGRHCKGSMCSVAVEHYDYDARYHSVSYY